MLCGAPLHHPSSFSCYRWHRHFTFAAANKQTAGIMMLLTTQRMLQPDMNSNSTVYSCCHQYSMHNFNFSSSSQAAVSWHLHVTCTPPHQHAHRQILAELLLPYNSRCAHKLGRRFCTPRAQATTAVHYLCCSGVHSNTKLQQL